MGGEIELRRGGSQAGLRLATASGAEVSRSASDSEEYCSNPSPSAHAPERAPRSWVRLRPVKGAPIHCVLLLSGAWLATLGACGRTEPRVEDTYGFAASGDVGDVGATGGTSRGGASGNATSTGGSRTGGTSTGGSSTGGSSTGGTSTGGSFAAGGVSGNSTSVGGSQIDDGGSTFVGGSGGDLAVGGSATGGSSVGGSSVGGAGGTTGGVGGSMTMPPPGGGITCGDVSCDPETSVCCQVRSTGSSCQPADADCFGAILSCSGPGSCDPGEVCCFHRRRSACQPTCEVSQGGLGNPPTIVLCDSTSDCGPNQTCVAAPRGIAYCGDNQ